MTEPSSPWRSRRYLPHFDGIGAVQSLTFRLHDSVPAHVIDEWRREFARLQAVAERAPQLRARIARYEDEGHGSSFLRDDRIAGLVEGALLEFDGDRYRLIAWCVMPNHVHALIETVPEASLDRVVQAWKSYSAHAANRILGRSGRFWAREYYDRFIRDDDHLAAAVRYIEANPVAAGLVRRAESWLWSSARHRSSSS